MFKRKKSQGVDPNRPVARAANNLFDLVASENLHAATQLLASGQFSDPVWDEVLLAYMTIVALEPESRESFDEWVSAAPEDRRASLSSVGRAMDTQRLDVLAFDSSAAAASALVGLAWSIGEVLHAVLRLVAWTATGSFETPSDAQGH